MLKIVVFLVGLSPAHGDIVHYCVDSRTNLRSVRATIWSFLLAGDTLKSVKDKERNEDCIVLNTSPEKEVLISKVVSERHPNVVRRLDVSREPSQSSVSEANIANVCRLLITAQGYPLRWLFLENKKWSEINYVDCQLDLFCTTEARTVSLRLRLPGTEVTRANLKPGEDWNVSTQDLRDCDKLRSARSLTVKAR